MTYLSNEQIAQLLRPINPRRVHQRDGMSHVEAYDVRAHLNRLFGFGRWSADVLDAEVLFETVGEHPRQQNRQVVSVGYRARLRLTVCAADGTVLATYTEVATGDAVNFPVNKRADAHDFAVKTAESQALKRAAVNLGDQFGLSLYRNGSTDAVVARTLVSGEGAAAEGVDDTAPEVVPQTAPADPEPADAPPADASPAPQGRRQTKSGDLNTLKAQIAAAMPGRKPTEIRQIVADSLNKPAEEWTVEDLTGFLTTLTEKAA